MDLCQRAVEPMECRTGCGACCIAASLNNPYFGMPQGKPAGERCVHLCEASTCLIFHDPRRPLACAQFLPELSVCGDDREQALANIAALELGTAPQAQPLDGVS